MAHYKVVAKVGDWKKGTFTQEFVTDAPNAVEARRKAHHRLYGFSHKIVSIKKQK